MPNLKTCATMFTLCFFSVGCDLKFQETTTVVPDQRATQLTIDSGTKSDPAWSPDGTMVAFSYQRVATNVTMRGLNGEELETLGTIDEDIRNAKFDLSPDGTKFVYHSNIRRHLWVLTLQNGSEFVLTPQHSDASEPAWSPDGQWVAFTAQGSTSDSRNVWVIPATGGLARKMTNTEGRDLLPSWSPDSKKIAFESIRDHHNGIWIVDIESGDSRQLTPDSTFNRAPDWSPDGSMIAYYSTRNTSTQIWTIPANGAEETQITNSIDATNPSWSPDGSKIAYRTSEGVWISSVSKEILNRSSVFENYPLWWPDGESLVGTINAGFSNIRTFSLADSTVSARTEQLDGQFDSAPEWYPDSRSIVFARITPGSLSRPTLWTKDVSGDGARPLIGNDNRSGPENNPSISPDGRWLAFDDGFKIFLVQLSDGTTVDLSPFIGSGLSEADWSPDSRSIVGNSRNTLSVFSVDAGMAVEQMMLPGRFSNPSWSFPHPVFGPNIAATGYSGIFVMREDGSNQELVISNGRSPSWSPDGNMLAFIKNNQLFVLQIFTALNN